MILSIESSFLSQVEVDLASGHDSLGHVLIIIEFLLVYMLDIVQKFLCGFFDGRGRIGC
jgi:hypothetical protein